MTTISNRIMTDPFAPISSLTSFDQQQTATSSQSTHDNMQTHLLQQHEQLLSAAATLSNGFSDECSTPNAILSATTPAVDFDATLVHPFHVNHDVPSNAQQMTFALPLVSAPSVSTAATMDGDPVANASSTFFLTVVEARGSRHKSIIDVIRVRSSSHISTLVIQMVHKFAPSLLFRSMPHVHLHYLRVMRLCLQISNYLFDLLADKSVQPNLKIAIAQARARGIVLPFVRERARQQRDSRASQIMSSLEEQQSQAECAQVLLPLNPDTLKEKSHRDIWLENMHQHYEEEIFSLEASVEEHLFTLRREQLEHLPTSIAHLTDKLPHNSKRGLSSSLESMSLSSVQRFAAVKKALDDQAGVTLMAIQGAGPRDAACDNKVDDYSEFIGRAWSDGIFLSNHLSVSTCHLTPQSTLYLLFECPYEHRALRQHTYGESEGKHGFSIFVRHPASLTLVRVNVHLNTTVGKLKAKIAQLSIVETEEERERRFEERRERLSSEQGTSSARESSASEEDEEATVKSARCILTHYGRVLFDEDSLIRAGVGPGDVLSLHDKIYAHDSALDSKYASAAWYQKQVCSLRVDRSTIHDVEALLCQLRERIDWVLYSPKSYHALQIAFKLLDTHHSNHLMPQEYVTSMQAFLRVVAQRLVTKIEQQEELLDDASNRTPSIPFDSSAGHESERSHNLNMARSMLRGWLEKDPLRTGVINEHSFAQPCVLPPSDHHVTFHHFVRLLSDSIVEVMRAKQIDYLYPLQSFSKPDWLKEHNHLSSDNYRLMHTIFSSLHHSEKSSELARISSTMHGVAATAIDEEKLSDNYMLGSMPSIKAALLSASTPGDVPVHLSEFLEKAGLSFDELQAVPEGQIPGSVQMGDCRSVSSTLSLQSANDTSSAYLLLQFLQSEQARHAQEEHDSALNLQSGYTFHTRRLHDCALATVIESLSQATNSDINEIGSTHTKATIQIRTVILAGIKAVLRFLAAPFLVVGKGTYRLWSGGAVRSLRQFLTLVMRQMLMLLTFFIISASFYLPMTLVAVYHTVAERSVNNQSTLLESWLPLAVTTLLVIYRVSDLVSSQVSGGDDESKLLEHKAQAKLVTLEMRAAPIVLDYPAKPVIEESTGNLIINEKLSRFGKVLNNAIERAEEEVEQPTPGVAYRQLQHTKQRTARIAPLNANQLEISNNDGAETSKSAINNQFEANSFKTPAPSPKANPIGVGKVNRLHMSKTILASRLFSSEPEDSHISRSLSALLMLVAFLNLLVPGLYRTSLGQPFFGEEWEDRYISGGAWVSLLAQAEFLRGLARACVGYHDMCTRLQNCRFAASAQLAYEHHLPFYLDLRVPQNLEYWLAVRERAKDVDESWIGMMAGAVVLDGALLIAVVVRVLFYKIKFDLFNIVAISNVVIWSAFIVVFLLIVVQANTELISEHLNMMQCIRKELSIAMCTGETWSSAMLHINDRDDDEIQDTWNEASHFHCEDDAEEEQRQMDLALGNEEHAHGDDVPKRSEKAKSDKMGSCPHNQESSEACMTCTIQSHAVTLSTKHSKRLHAVHGLVERLQLLANKADVMNILAMKFQRFELELRLVETTISHMQALDEPIELLGLVVDRALVMQIGAVILTGAASAASQLVPSTSDS